MNLRLNLPNISNTNTKGAETKENYSLSARNFLEHQGLSEPTHLGNFSARPKLSINGAQSNFKETRRSIPLTLDCETLDPLIYTPRVKTSEDLGSKHRRVISRGQMATELLSPTAVKPVGLNVQSQKNSSDKAVLIANGKSRGYDFNQKVVDVNLSKPAQQILEVYKPLPSKQGNNAKGAVSRKSFLETNQRTKQLTCNEIGNKFVIDETPTSCREAIHTESAMPSDSLGLLPEYFAKSDTKSYLTIYQKSVASNKLNNPSNPVSKPYFIKTKKNHVGAHRKSKSGIISEQKFFINFDIQQHKKLPKNNPILEVSDEANSPIKHRRKEVYQELQQENLMNLLNEQELNDPKEATSEHFINKHETKEIKLVSDLSLKKNTVPVHKKISKEKAIDLGFRLTCPPALNGGKSEYKFNIKPHYDAHVHHIAGCLPSPVKKRKRTKKFRSSIKSESKLNNKPASINLLRLEQETSPKQGDQIREAIDILLTNTEIQQKPHKFVESSSALNLQKRINDEQVSENKVFMNRFQFQKNRTRPTCDKLPNFSKVEKHHLSYSQTFSNGQTNDFLREVDQVLSDELKAINSYASTCDQTPKQGGFFQIEPCKFNKLAYRKRHSNESFELENEDILESTRSGKTPKSLRDEENQLSFQHKPLISPKTRVSPRAKERLLHTFSFKHCFVTINVMPPDEECESSFEEDIFSEPQVGSLEVKAEDKEGKHILQRKDSGTSDKNSDKYSTTFDINKTRPVKEPDVVAESLSCKYVKGKLGNIQGRNALSEYEINSRTSLDREFKLNLDYNFSGYFKGLIQSCIDKKLFQQLGSVYMLTEEDVRPAKKLMTPFRYTPARYALDPVNSMPLQINESFWDDLLVTDAIEDSEFIDDQKDTLRILEDHRLKFISGEIGKITQELVKAKDCWSTTCVMTGSDWSTLMQMKEYFNPGPKIWAELNAKKPDEFIEKQKKILRILKTASQENWSAIATFYKLDYKDLLLGDFNFDTELGPANIPDEDKSPLLIELAKLSQSIKPRERRMTRLSLLINDLPSAESPRLSVRLDPRKPHVNQNNGSDTTKSSQTRVESQFKLFQKEKTMSEAEDYSKEKRIQEAKASLAYIRAARARDLRKIAHVNPSDSSSPESREEPSTFERTQTRLNSLGLAKKVSYSTSIMRSESQTETLPDFLPLSKMRTMYSEDTFEGLDRLQVPTHLSLNKLSTIGGKNNDETQEGSMTLNIKVPSNTSLSPKLSPKSPRRDKAFKYPESQTSLKEPVTEQSQVLQEKKDKTNELNRSSVKKKETKDLQDGNAQLRSEQAGVKESNSKTNMTLIKIQNKVVVNSNARKRKPKPKPIQDLWSTLKEKILEAICFNRLYDLRQILFLYPRGTYEMKDDEGNTLLMVATKCGFKDILNEFLEHGIDINHQNVEGNTALHLALIYQHFDISDILIKNGAKQHIKNFRGQTPWEAIGYR